jgi:hypothetical protein
VPDGSSSISPWAAVVVLTSRYDLFAAAAPFWSLRAARQERWSAAWTWSAVGFLLKLFPAALWPVLLIGEWRSSGRFPVRRLWWMLGSVAVIAGLPALLDPSATVNVLRYYLHRPTESGSLPAGLSLLADWHGWHWVSSYHSLNVQSPVAGPLSLAFEVAAAAVCVAVWWAQARNRLPLDAACLATLTLLVLGGKVLSAQYLMWLMPFWAFYRLRVWWVLAAMAKTFWFAYDKAYRALDFMSENHYVVSLQLIDLTRDVLIAVGTWMWLRNLAVGQNPVGPANSPVTPGTKGTSSVPERDSSG